MLWANGCVELAFFPTPKFQLSWRGSCLDGCNLEGTWTGSALWSLAFSWKVQSSASQYLRYSWPLIDFGIMWSWKEFTRGDSRVSIGEERWHVGMHKLVRVLFFGFPRVGGWVLLVLNPCSVSQLCAVSSHLKVSCFLHFNMYGSLLVKCPAVPDCFTWLQLGKMQWAQNCTQGWMSYEYVVKDLAFCSRLHFLRKPSLPGAWRTRWHSAKSRVNGALLCMSRWCTSVATSRHSLWSIAYKLQLTLTLYPLFDELPLDKLVSHSPQMKHEVAN